MLQLQNIILYFYQESGHNQTYILSRFKMLYPTTGLIWPQTGFPHSSASHILQISFSMGKKKKQPKQKNPKEFYHRSFQDESYSVSTCTVLPRREARDKKSQEACYTKDLKQAKTTCLNI